MKLCVHNLKKQILKDKQDTVYLAASLILDILSHDSLSPGYQL